MNPLRIFPILFLAATIGLPAQPAEEPRIKLSFPGTSAFEVLATYESLTGKKIIRDSNLAGPQLTIIASQPVTKAEAISLIESSLLLNGYSLVPAGDGAVKVLGPARMPRAEGLPLYTDESKLPAGGDQLASFFKPLRFISPDEAVKVLQGVIQLNAYGSLVPVSNASAIVITEKTPVIRRALALLDLIDLQPAQVVTEFVPLKRASAAKVVELLEEMFDEKDREPSQGGSAAPQAPEQEGEARAATGVQYENRLLAGRTRFLADKRTNRVLIVTRRENHRYVRDLIGELDSAGSFESPYVRQVNYIPVADIFPVLADMLREKDDEPASNPVSELAAQPARQQQAALSPDFQGAPGSGGLGFGNGRNSGNLDSPDTLTNAARISAPQSLSLGEIRLVADNSENAIIVFGPPEAKERARQILDLLDRRPKQVYLAVVIGQLRVGDGLDYGVNYIVRYNNFEPLRRALGNAKSENGGMAAALTPQLLPGVDVVPDASALLTPEAFTALSGLTIFGTIADSVDIFARFLETTNNFRTLSRPVIYTTNNRPATILSGQRVPVPVSSLTSTTPGIDENAAITSNIEYQDVVLKLEVLPLINSDSEVNLIIKQTNDNIVGFDSISGNQVPRIATQRITTSVRVPNGRTIVLGGLISEDSGTNKEGIPYVTRIPVLGSLLGGRTNKSKERRELIVMIQPMVVDSNEEMLRKSAYEGGRTALGQEGLGMVAPRPEVVRMAPPPSPAPKTRKSWLPWAGKKE